MFTRIPSCAGAMVAATVLLAGAAILQAGYAAADSAQDDRFLALLDQEGIPALSGIPNVISTAHAVCRALDRGESASTVVDTLANYAHGVDPTHSLGRYQRTQVLFVRAAVEAFCPYHRSG